MKLTQLASFACVLFFASMAQAQLMLPKSSNDYPMTLETATGYIHGTLTLPSSNSQLPIVLMIAGSGPTDRDGNNPQMKNNSLKQVSQVLSDAGIASLRYDKRGIAASKAAMKTENDIRFEHYIEDAAAWINLLKSDQRFSKVIVLGHSEGSLIGMIAAKESDADAFISVAGAGRSADKVLTEQLNQQSVAIKQMADPIIESLKNGEMVHEVPPLLSALFRPSVQAYLISWFKYDPSKEISHLKMPVLIVQGSTDIQVDTLEAYSLKKALPSAQLTTIKGMNHILKKASSERTENIRTYNNPHLALHPDFCVYVLNFITKQCK